MDVEEAEKTRQQHQPGHGYDAWYYCAQCGDPWPCRMWRLAAVVILERVRDGQTGLIW